MTAETEASMDEEARMTGSQAPGPGTLTPIEARVLGSLIEKEITTPEYYPLTLNALTNACCQKNNREPVVSYDETTVVRALEGLREKKLVSTVTGAGIRVPKYRHKIVEAYGLTPAETALVALLMLRGPQTVGELRTRGGPMHEFESLADVQHTLDGLTGNETRAGLVRLLARLPGQKEARYTHLLGGDTPAEQPRVATRPEKAVIQVMAENERITTIERNLERMQAALGELQRQFTEFRKQFE